MTATTLQQLRANEGMAGSDIFQQLLARPIGGFDPDAWHVMQLRDNALIRDEIMHGVASDAFVYNFSIKGKPVVGVSVVGARELASQYKGIKARIVATVEKRGSLFIFRTFTPLSIDTRLLPELADETDYYECVMEVSDIKSGNSIEVRKKESKTELTKEGKPYERPHYDVICESKAFRNGVLNVLPQSVIRDFRDRCLKAGKVSDEATIQQRRAAASAFAAKNAVTLNREALDRLTYDELTGLGAASKEGLDHFKRAAAALGLTGSVDRGTGEIEPPKDDGKKPNPTGGQEPVAGAGSVGTSAAGLTQANWTPSPQEAEAIRQREIAEANAQGQQPQATQGRRSRSTAAPE